MKLGDVVYSKKLHPRRVSGLVYKQQYGNYTGILYRPAILTIRKASRYYVCEDCFREIHKGTLHGSNFYTHLCLNCVTDEEPKPEFVPDH